jgi:hypothetical protein
LHRLQHLDPRDASLARFLHLVHRADSVVHGVNGIGTPIGPDVALLHRLHRGLGCTVASAR